MAVGDARRSMPAGDREVDGCGKPDVPVHDGMMMVGKERLAGSSIDGVVGDVISGNLEHLSAEFTNFLVIIASTHVIDKEIKLDALAVDVSIQIHDECFGATTIHGADDVEDAERLCVQRLAP